MELKNRVFATNLDIEINHYIPAQINIYAEALSKKAIVLCANNDGRVSDILSKHAQEIIEEIEALE